MKSPRLLLAFLCAALLGACSSVSRTEADQWASQHKAFRSNPKTAPMAFVNPEVEQLLTPSTTSIKISLEDQRARILYKEEIVAMDFPVSTGKRGFRTTPGDYKIIDRRREHKSNLYGRYVDKASGNILERDVDARKDPKPEGARFAGAPMPYFMRLTNRGLGLHVGYVPKYPASHGCIRVPSSIMPRVWNVAPLKTSVSIFPESFDHQEEEDAQKTS